MTATTHHGRPPPVFYLAEVTGQAGQHIRWLAAPRGLLRATTTSLADARLFTDAELDEHGTPGSYNERWVAVPAPLAAHFAVVVAGEARVPNHADIWVALEGAVQAEAA